MAGISALEGARQLHHKAARNLPRWIENWGVLSLGDDPDNGTLWEQYADNHKGVCFGFRKRALIEFCKKCADIDKTACGYGPVLYPPVLPQWDTADLESYIVECSFLNKEFEWSHQEEWRLFFYSSSMSEIVCWKRKKQLDAGILGNVILGADSDSHIEAFVRRELKQKSDVKLYKEDKNGKIRSLET